MQPRCSVLHLSLNILNGSFTCGSILEEQKGTRLLLKLNHKLVKLRVNH